MSTLYLYCLLLVCLLSNVISESTKTCEPSSNHIIEKLDAVDIAKKLIQEHDSGSWLQIGANSMDEKFAIQNPIMLTLDAVPHWLKYFIEPIPYVYEKLVKNAAKWPNVTTVHSALSGNGGYFEGLEQMYCIEGYERHTHNDADQVCSFDKKHVIKHFPDAKVTQVDVASMSVSVLLAMYDIHDIRIMVIDTEGFDAKVIQALPFGIIRPPFIIYEHVHLHPDERRAADEYLMKHCYSLYNDQNENTYALHEDYLKFLK